MGSVYIHNYKSQLYWYPIIINVSADEVEDGLQVIFDYNR